VGVSEKVERGETPSRDYAASEGWAGNDAPTPAERRRVAVELVRDHESQLRASARRVSICSDDAEDAVQRGIEILLLKAPTADARRLLPWARTVVRNEALAIRRSRERVLARPAPDPHGDGRGDRDWVADLPSGSDGPSELVVRRERIERGREALALLKPQELKALTQLAHGYSYAEIGAINGWTRTKVNRCLAEGRARLRSVVEESEAGKRCEAVVPLISACADGELDAKEVATVRNHLAVCGSCRATLREYRSIPSRVAALAPAGPVASDIAPEGISGRVAEWVDGLVAAAWTRASALLPGQDAGLGATLASGGIRGAGAAGLAKLTAICVGTAGGAAACVAAGVLPVPMEKSEMPPSARTIERRVEQVGPRLTVDPTPAPLSGRPDTDTTPNRVEPSSERPSVPAETEPPEPVATEFAPEGAGAPAPVPAAAPTPPPTPRVESQRPASTPLSGEFQP
jgi:RNA polymerase sigma factor (sigma-70 family)